MQTEIKWQKKQQKKRKGIKNKKKKNYVKDK